MDAPEIRLRESPRVAVEARARLFLGAAPEVEARLLDLSATGMGLATGATAAAGQTCAFELALDDGTIEGRGVVVWSRRARSDRGDAPNLGIRFESLDPRAAAVVRSLIDRRLAGRRQPARMAPPPAPRAAAPVPTRAVAATVEALAPVGSTPVTRTPPAAPVVPAAVEPAAAVRPAAAVAPPPDIEEPAARSSRTRPLVLAGVAVVAIVSVVVVLANRGSDGEGSAPATTATVELPPEAEAPAPAVDEPLIAVEVPESEPIGDPANDGFGDAGIVPAAEAIPVPAEEHALAPVPLPTTPRAAVVVPGEVGAPAEVPAAGARARRLLAIEPGTSEGEEVLVLRADAPFRRADVFSTLMGIDPPRFLLRLSGIERQWRPPTLEVGSPLIQRVRTGLHSTDQGPELHVVVDLVSREVEPTWEIDGDTLRVRVRPRTPPAARTP